MKTIIAVLIIAFEASCAIPASAQWKRRTRPGADFKGFASRGKLYTTGSPVTLGKLYSSTNSGILWMGDMRDSYVLPPKEWKIFTIAPFLTGAILGADSGRMFSSVALRQIVHELEITQSQADVVSLLEYPYDSLLFAGTFGDGLFRTSDNGISWSNANNGMTNANIGSLAFVPLVSVEQGPGQRTKGNHG